MDLDSLKDKASGVMKEAEGKATGDKARELQGKAEEAKGKLKDAVDEAGEKIKENVDEAKDAAKKAYKDLSE